MDASLFSTDSDRVCSDRDEDLQQSVDLITSDLNRKLDLESNHDSTPQLLPDSDVHEGFEHEDEEDNDDDFTFMYIGDKDSPKVFEDGQIWPVFPLFDQNLLLGGEYEVEEIDRLPVHPTVDKIFIESPRGRNPPSTESENDDSAAGPFCVWSKESGTTGTAELSKKSNSTGFSKLWRIREKVGRSNSDGRDAFVFLKSSDRTSTTTTSSSSSASSSSSVKPATGAGSVNATGEKPRVVKAKKPTVSPLEAYLRSKERQTEEERRRTHLPYRPKHTGFFTNVHGGLSRNVHPY